MRSLVIVAGFILVFTQALYAQSGPDDEIEKDDDWVTVDGFLVEGFSDGTKIGEGWYPTLGEAEQAKTKMEGIETTNGKFYDKVTISSETRRFRRPRGSTRRDEPETPSQIPNRKPLITKPTLRIVDIPTAPKGPVIEGAQWSGTEGGQQVSFKFGANRTVQAFDKYGTWNGTWSISKNVVSIELTQPRRILYTLTLVGQRLTGKATNPADGSTWGVDLAAASPPKAVENKYTLWTGVFSGNSTKKEYSSLEEAQAALQNHRVENAGRQPKWVLQDSSGKEISRGQDGVR